MNEDKKQVTFEDKVRKTVKTAAIVGGAILGGATLIYAWVGVGVTMFADDLDPKYGIRYVREMSRRGWQILKNK